MSKYKPSTHEWGTDASTKRAKELTPNESSKDGKIASGSKVVHSQKRNDIKEKTMPLSAKDPIAKWIDDFKKSDAPQFKGKSGEDRKAMAIAAYMGAKKGAKQEKNWDSEVRQVEEVEEAAVHINLDDTPSARQNKVTKILKRHETKGNIKHAGSTDKGELFDVKKPAMLAGINRELKAVGGGYQLGEGSVNQVESLSRVEIEGLGPVFVDGSPAVVKNDLRKMFKKPDFIKNVERVTPADAKKYFRGMAAGKVEEDVAERACWDTHKKVGTKMKNGKRVNDCVPKNEDSQQTDTDLHTNASAKRPENYRDKDGKVKVRMVPAHKDIEKESVEEFLMVKKNPMRTSSSSSSSSSSSRSSGRKGAPSSTSGQSVTTTSGNGYKIKRNIKTGQTTKSRYNVGGSAAQKESIMSPSSQEFIPSPTGGKRYATSKVEKKEGNPVAKYMNTYNKAKTYTDRKKADKRGYVKHKGAMQESMDPRDHTDKAGHLVVVTKPGGKKMIKQYHPTSSGAKKYADRINKTNRVGHKATVHKTDGRRIMEEVSIQEATSQKLLSKMKELAPKGQLPRSSVELRKLKARAQEELRGAAKAKKAAPKKQSTTKTSTGKKHMGSMEAGDRNIVMQLRKAQDLKGNHDIIVSPKGRTARLPKAMIDKLLTRFDSLQKPQEKRKFQIMVTKELRKRAK